MNWRIVHNLIAVALLVLVAFGVHHDVEAALPVEGELSEAVWSVAFHDGVILGCAVSLCYCVLFRVKAAAALVAFVAAGFFQSPVFGPADMLITCGAVYHVLASPDREV